MAAVYALGQFSIPNGSTAAITPSLTWSDAGSHTPQAILFLGRSGTNASANTSHIYASEGFTDGTTHFTAGIYQADAASATVGASRVADGGVIVETDNGTESGLLGFTSFGTDQFTVTPSNAFLVDWDVKFIAFAGLTGAKVLNSTVATTTGNFSKTGVGFQGDTGFFMLGRGGTMNGGGTATGLFSFGFVDNGGLMGGIFNRYIMGGVTSNYIWGACSTAEIMARCNTSATTHVASTAFVSWDADGYTLNQLIADGTGYQYGSLILKGITSKRVTTAHQTGTGTFNVAVSGVTPKCVVGLCDNTNTATNSSSTEAASVTIGAHTAGAQWSQQYLSYNAEVVGGGSPTEEYSLGVTDKFMLHHVRSAANTFSAQGEIAKSSFTNEQVTLDQVDADTSGFFVPMLVMGETYTPGASYEKEIVRRGIARGLARGLVG